MRKSTRQVLFFLFATTFLVSAPLVVLFTAGFRISLNNQRIQQTGALAIHTSPRGATVTIDGKILTSKTPTVAQHVTPSTVSVLIERKGYISWEQSAQVEAGQTTYMNALMFADVGAEALLLSQSKKTDPLPSPNGRYVGFIERDGATSARVSFYDVSADYTRTLITLSEDTSQPASLRWLPDSSALLVIKNSRPLVGFTLTGERIEDSALSALLLSSSPVSLIDTGNMVEVRSTSDRLVGLLPPGAYTTLEGEGDYILLRDSRNNLYLISLTASDVIALSVPGIIYDWLPDENLLVWSDGLEVNTYAADSGERAFLTRQSTLITGVAWHPSGEAVLLGTETGVTAIQTKQYLNRTQTPLLSAENLRAFSVDETGKNLYFYGNVDGIEGLYRRRLVK